LQVGVDRDEIDAGQAFVDHSVQRVSAAAANTHNAYLCSASSEGVEFNWHDRSPLGGLIMMKNEKQFQ
jgi:hypothetical protein